MTHWSNNTIPFCLTKELYNKGCERTERHIFTSSSIGHLRLNEAVALVSKTIFIPENIRLIK